MLEKIISGGQTGADLGAIDAALECGFPYGGSLPRGRKTEAGPLPERYEMQELSHGGYPERTEQNVKDSDGTVIFFRKTLTGGSRLTAELARKWGKPCLEIDLDRIDKDEAVKLVADWTEENSIGILNVAGPRASTDKDIYSDVRQIVKDLIRLSLKG